MSAKRDVSYQQVVLDLVEVMLQSGVWTDHDPAALVAYAAEIVAEVAALKAPEVES